MLHFQNLKFSTALVLFKGNSYLFYLINPAKIVSKNDLKKLLHKFVYQTLAIKINQYHIYQKLNILNNHKKGQIVPMM